jgi:hypothetical protein
MCHAARYAALIHSRCWLGRLGRLSLSETMAEPIKRDEIIFILGTSAEA